MPGQRAWWHTLVSVVQHSAGSGPAATSTPGEYAEQLRAPWWLWLVGLGTATVASAEVFMGAPGAPLWAPYVILLPLTAFGLWRVGRIRIVVRAGELSVAGTHLPLRYVAEVGVLDAAGKRAALGSRADPLARVVQRPWVPRAVLVILDRPGDPTPYWMISSRQPERLARVIRAAGSATG
jgi:hypothetical protein